MRLFSLLIFALGTLSPWHLYAQQDLVWSPDTFRLVEDDPEIAPETSAHAQVGPFGFDFFCHAYGGSDENLLLAVTPAEGLSGRWQETFLAGGFDGTAAVMAGDNSVGEVQSFSESATGNVIMTFEPGQYNLDALISGQDLGITFSGANNDEFRLNVGGGNIGPALCSVVSACGRGVPEICGVFTAVTGVRTDAVPLGETLDSDGNPRWFKSEFRKPGSLISYYRTASVVDPDTETELHMSCIAREGRLMAIHHLRRESDGSAVMFANPDVGQTGDIQWSTAGSSGLFAETQVLENGEGLQLESIESNLMLQATLETMMTTPDAISVTSVHNGERITSSFSSTGSRDTICNLMKGCSMPLGLSPACSNRN